MFCLFSTSQWWTRLLQLRSRGGSACSIHQVPPGGTVSDPTQVTIVIRVSITVYWSTLMAECSFCCKFPQPRHKTQKPAQSATARGLKWPNNKNQQIESGWEKRAPQLFLKKKQAKNTLTRLSMTILFALLIFALAVDPLKWQGREIIFERERERES